MKYWLSHITQMGIPAALMLMVCALGMWVVDYVRTPEVWMNLLCTQILVLISGLQLCTLLYRAKTTAQFTLLPAVLYIVAVAVFPYLRFHWQPQLFVILLLFFALATRNASESDEPNGLVFFFSLLFGILSLQMPDALWGILLLWGTMLVQYAFSLRTILASLLGIALVAVYYVLAMYIGVADNWDFSILFSREWVGNLLPACLTVSLLIMIAGLTATAIAAFVRSSYDLVSTRMLFYYTILWGVISVPLILFSTVAPDFIGVLSYVCAAISSIFILQKQSEGRGVTFLLYLIVCVTLYAWGVISL